jgi:malic enzyme
MSRPEGREQQAEELLARAAKPGQDALRLHPFYRGKMQTVPKCPVRGFDDFAIWYSPGVAAPCRAIAADPERALQVIRRSREPLDRLIASLEREETLDREQIEACLGPREASTAISGR